jgi:hypothetical protein
MADGDRADRMSQAELIRLRLERVRELAADLRVRGGRRAEEARERAQRASERASEVRARRERTQQRAQGKGGYTTAVDLAWAQDCVLRARESAERAHQAAAESWDASARLHAAAAHLYDLAVQLGVGDVASHLEAAKRHRRDEETSARNATEDRQAAEADTELAARHPEA